ncbi:MAG TPA: hypothetical protein VKU19_20530 [Bryobacteraceae bacterium]|nr:hypothetical protein [Bryobacteraceae bacterium]
MTITAHEPLNVSNEERSALAELLEAERVRLLLGIRHSHHRAFRDELRQRLSLMEELLERCRPSQAQQEE